MPQIYDMGPTPSEGRRAEDFFALKNPTASAGFEPANLGTKGQHATPRPPKLLKTQIHIHKKKVNIVLKFQCINCYLRFGRKQYMLYQCSIKNVLLC